MDGLCLTGNFDLGVWAAKPGYRPTSLVHYCRSDAAAKEHHFHVSSSHYMQYLLIQTSFCRSVLQSILTAYDNFVQRTIQSIQSTPDPFPSSGKLWTGPRSQTFLFIVPRHVCRRIRMWTLCGKFCMRNTIAGAEIDAVKDDVLQSLMTAGRPHRSTHRVNRSSRPRFCNLGAWKSRR